jgi:isoquinoline 1-oxidoreductase subunit alpha
MIELNVNGKAFQTEVAENTPLLWLLRDHLKISEIKYRCGEGLCGDCTVQVDGKPIRSCITPVGEMRGKSLTTIE